MTTADNQKSRGFIEKIGFVGAEDQFYEWTSVNAVKPQSFSVPEVSLIERDRGFARLIMEDLGSSGISRADLKRSFDLVAGAAAEISLLPERNIALRCDNSLNCWSYDGTGPAQIERTLRIMLRRCSETPDARLVELRSLIEECAQPLVEFSKEARFLFAHGDLHPGNMRLREPSGSQGRRSLCVFDWGACGFSLAGSDLYSLITTFPDDSHLHHQAVDLYQARLKSAGTEIGNEAALKGAFAFTFMSLAMAVIKGGRSTSYEDLTWSVGKGAKRILAHKSGALALSFGWIADVESWFMMAAMS